MYKSLKATCSEDFMLYIFAFCGESYKLLKDLNLENVTVVSLDELEEGIPRLKEVKKDRTKGEYCWTCGSATIKYCIEKFNLDQCTYLDADIYFYSDPRVLLDEMEDKSILITEHRYTPCYDQTKTSGRYCVQFISFKNDTNGMTALNWWVDKCLEWCYARFEDNKFGDQKYLDDWADRFEGVQVLEHLGGGVAPWNVQQYTIEKKGGSFFVNKDIPLVFYHFHNIKFDEKGDINLSFYLNYSIDKYVEKNIYKPYIKNLSLESKNFHRKNNKVKILKNKYKLSDILKKYRKKFIKIKFGRNAYLEIFGIKII